jgi:2,4-dienoyl-CoA reductase-like NADH-dependent reductase (Old Yellow Enzyme family)
MKFRNRVVMPPMVTQKADRDGNVTDALLEHYGARAAAGTGLIIVEATAVDRKGRVWDGGLGAYDDSHVSGLARLAARIHEHGAVAGIQLVHGGPQASPDLCDGDRVGPSAVPPPDEGQTPRELNRREIEEIQDRFAEAAVRALEAGFDLAEMHGAHDYLLDSFLAAKHNWRKDAYGGSITRRAAMLAETCERAKSAMGNRGLLCCRISLFNKPEGEFTQERLREVLGMLVEAGVDVLHISTDGAFKEQFGSGKTPGILAKEACDLPVIVAGGLGDPEDAERAVAEGHADFAAVGSAMYEDAVWTEKARAALGC